MAQYAPQMKHWKTWMPGFPLWVGSLKFFETCVPSPGVTAVMGENWRPDSQILRWEVTGIFFILLVGSTIHFLFELSNFWRPVAPFAAVNESTWEHLKMVFWPGLIFFLFQYSCFKDKECASHFWVAKAFCLILMPLIIAGGFYGVVALTGQHYFAADIALFVAAIVVGQLVSYKILCGRISPSTRRLPAIIAIILLAIAFMLFTFFPPRIFLFEHMDLENTGQYGILDSYEGLRVFD